ncbi:hypothetical protein ACJIZ3_010764 [Penstemon smallii]|uniref:Uncharacterized protein n=1 Tax=Penstemon smallii TaxID=265156 RepID=A0ABD3UHD3_9LAMI
MGSLSRLSQQSPTPSDNYLIYAPFCACNPNVTISTFIESYNPSNNSWNRVTSIPGHGQNLVLKDFAMVSIGYHIYVIGGRLCCKFFGQNSDNIVEALIDPMVLSCVRRYNVRTGSWDLCAPMNTPRFNFACTVADDKIYVAGGQNTLGRATGISSTECNFYFSFFFRYKCVGVTWQDKIHVVGGFVAGGENQGPFVMTRSTSEVYDPERDIWVLKSRMWELDVPPNQIVTVNGRLFSSGDCLKPWKGHIEVYDEMQKLWTMVHGSHFNCASSTSKTEEVGSNGASMRRLFLTMAPIGTQLYFLCGCKMSGKGEASRLRSEVHVFDTAANGGGWRSYEPVEEEGEKELCGHCCILKQDF